MLIYLVSLFAYILLLDIYWSYTFIVNLHLILIILLISQLLIKKINLTLGIIPLIALFWGFTLHCSVGLFLFNVKNK